MKLLLIYNEHSKARQLQDVSKIFTLVEETFDLTPKSYLLQKFDKDFNEYVDFEDISSLEDKDKIKIKLKQNYAPVQVCNSENSFTLSTASIIEDVPNVVVLPIHLKQWPQEVMLPFQDFSGPLQETLNSTNNLSWDNKREIIGHLANYAYSFKPYPNKKERLEICESLVRKYPYLRNDVGAGIGGWELKLLNKIKKIRQGDSSLEVQLHRLNSKVVGQKVPKKIDINPKKGELNWAPDHVNGETSESVNIHKKILREESLKSEKFQEKDKIASLMALTYSFRREMINNKIKVSDLRDEYPIFFQTTEQLEEFHRLTAVPMSNFFNEVMEQGPLLYEMFVKKKKSAEELSFLEYFKEETKDLDFLERQKSKSTFGIFILPFLLKEVGDCIFRVVSYLILKFYSYFYNFMLYKTESLVFMSGGVVYFIFNYVIFLSDSR